MAEREESVPLDSPDYTVHHAEGWQARSMTDLVAQLEHMPIGQTSTVFRRGVANKYPGCSVTVSRVLDGWMVHTEVHPEPGWVAVLRGLLSMSKRSVPEREEPT